MSATAEMIADLRRMVQEPDGSGGYGDAVLKRYIERFPCLDERGSVPYTWNTATTPPTKKTNTDWVATYDLHAAAQKVWEEKAGAFASKYGFTADGGQYQRQQAYKQMMGMARHHGARRKPSTIKLKQWPVESVAADLPDDLSNSW